ncbi:CCD86 protein, partial [Polyodon spathula]|nr:coiled-coil domain-containing protein 86 [Polyodon spathula]MBN3275363.1 CCD86 protein [Polyodon spathula]
MPRRSQRTKPELEPPQTSEPPTGAELGLEPEGTATRSRTARRSRVTVPEPGQTPTASKTRSRKSVHVFETAAGGAEPVIETEEESGSNGTIRPAETVDATEGLKTDLRKIKVSEIKSPQTDLSVTKASQDPPPTSDANININNEAAEPTPEPTAGTDTGEVHGPGQGVTSEKENVSGVPAKRIKLDGKRPTGSEPNRLLLVPLGKPKSGRIWKERHKKRFSNMVSDKPLKTSWEKKMKAKEEKKLTKDLANQLKEDKAKEKEDKRKRREENLKRKQENERKSEIVQVIRNPAKMKRMKRKQLRRIEKRDTLALLQKNKNKAEPGSGRPRVPGKAKTGAPEHAD